MTIQTVEVGGRLRRVGVARGGEGSGHHGHRGRPGEVGGSAPSSETVIEVGDVGEAPGSRVADKQAARSAVRELRERGTISPLDPRDIVFGVRHDDDETSVVVVNVSEWQGTMHLESIMVPTDEQGRGAASFILDEILIPTADKYGVEITAIAEPIGESGLPKKALIRWYLRHGFELVDTPGGDDIIYRPQGAAVARGGPGSGHFGHEGRIGEVGGSQPSGGDTLAVAPPSDYRSRDWRAVADGFQRTASRLSPFEMTKANFTGFWLSPDGEIYRVQGMRHNEVAEEAIEAARDQLSPSVLEYYQELKQSFLTDSPALDVTLELGFIRGWMSAANGPKEISITIDEAATDLRRAQKQTLLDIFSVAPDREYDFVWAVYPTGGSHMPIESGRDRDEFMARFGMIQRQFTPPQPDMIARALAGFNNALSVVEAMLTRGGPGSGHRGHKGRPGKVGGSQPSGGGAPTEGDRLDDERRRAVDMFRAGKGTPEGLALLLDDLEWNGSPEHVEIAAQRAGIPFWDIYRFVEALRTTRMSYVAMQLNLYAEGMPEFADIMSTQADFVDEPLNGQFRRADIPWGMPDRDPALVERLNEIEAEIGELDYEVAYVLTPGGDVILHKEGTVDEVRFSEEEIALMEGAVMIHNHPSNSAFSDDDINIAVDAGALETIVVGRGGKRYIMGLGGYVGDVDREVVRRQAIGYYHSADFPVRQVFGPLVEQHRLSPVHASFYHGIEQWLRVEREMPDHIDFVYQNKDMK